VFFKSEFNSTTAFERPYLACNLGRPLKAVETDANHPKHPQSHDYAIECLGITLLELCYGRALETFQQYAEARDIKCQNMYNFNIRVAKVLCRHVDGDYGLEVQAAIEWCLNNCDASMSGEQWRKEFFEEVVVPFYNYIQLFDGKGLSGTTHYGNISDGAVAFYGNAAFTGPVFLGMPTTSYPSKHMRLRTE